MPMEQEAFRVWWQLRPTMADVFLLVVLISFGFIGWRIVVSDRKIISENRKERQSQIDDIKQLVLSNIKEIKNSFSEHIHTMKEVVEKLQDEKKMIGEHLVRHEKIAEDIIRICKTLDDHEARVRSLERWDGKERRK